MYICISILHNCILVHYLSSRLHVVDIIVSPGSMPEDTLDSAALRRRRRRRIIFLGAGYWPRFCPNWYRGVS